ncbi:MAG: hypothetical protein ACI9FB_003081 [Candidatus Azotimanducaceae bacterium]|jgi:uncharacterized protein YbgA (DUF1722 family)/uncharacterized protein YbbK (DUF523 family)
MNFSPEKINVGISSCLLGDEVRYNGGHKHSSLCTRDLSQYFEFVSVCPEVSIGLGIPRKPIRLVGNPKDPDIVGVDNSDQNVTQDMKVFAREKVKELTKLSGYIFIKGSPSCGLFRVKVYNEKGYPQEEMGRGVYAKIVTDTYPLLPVEEAGRLQDAVLRENFITRVFAYRSFQDLRQESLTAQKLLEFHASYKYTLMAHDPQSYNELGRMLADLKNKDLLEIGEKYFAGLMTSLEMKASRKSNTNVLMHLQGYLKTHLTSEEKERFGEILEQYRTGIIPLIVPITLLRNYFHTYPNDYISKQAYLQPYPDNLSLRNSI